MLTIINSLLGENRGQKRVWLEGKKLANAGINPGDLLLIKYDMENMGISIKVDEHGTQKVSKRERNGVVSPIIDLCNQMVSDCLDGIDMIRIVVKSGIIKISPHQINEKVAEREDRLLSKVQEGRALDVCSLFHGAGILDSAMHEGLAFGGVKSRLAAAIEMESKYLETSLRNNVFWDKKSIAINSKIENVKIPANFYAEVLYGGIPCTGASLSGISKNKISCAEAHNSAGAAFHYFLNFVDALNPAIAIIENVAAYQSTASYFVIKSVLSNLGYNIQERILGGNEFGALEDRQRLVVVAYSKGLEFDEGWLDSITSHKEKPDNLGAILEDIPLDSPRWKEFDYLAKKEVRDKADGKGFSRQLCTPDSTKVGTIGHGYAKCRSTEPFLRHPLDNNKSRLLTIVEHARVKEIPTRLINGLSDVIAHQVMGQAVIYSKFTAVARSLAITLKEQAKNHFEKYIVAPVAA